MSDAAGNRITTDNGSAVTMVASAGSTVLGAATKTTVDGIASFDNVGISGTIGVRYVLSFVSSGLALVEQDVEAVPARFGSGTRIVGVDMPAGLYRSDTSGPWAPACHWARLRGLGGTPGEVIADYTGSRRAVVAIGAADNAFTSTGCGQWVQVTAAATTVPTAPFGAGVFIIGTDIASGAWRSNGPATNCYWARLRGFGGLPGDIISDSLGAAPTIVTIDPTDLGFRSDGCGVCGQAELMRLVRSPLWRALSRHCSGEMAGTSDTRRLKPR